MLEFNVTILIQFATYLILLFVLNLVLYRPLRTVMQNRRQSIEGGHKRARDLEGQIEERMAKYQQKLEQARQAGAREREELKADAAKHEVELLSAARADALEKLQGIRAQVGQEADAARQKLQEDAQAHASLIASKVLGRSL